MKAADPLILLVDDNPHDALLMRTVFARAGLAQPLRHADSGDAAIAYLRGDGPYRDRRQFPLPTTVLLDLNMPGRHGFEVLDWIRHQARFRRLRICILSTSGRPGDIERAYELGATSYQVKPGSLDGLQQLAQSLVGWHRRGDLASPPEGRAGRNAPRPGGNGHSHRESIGAQAPGRDSVRTGSGAILP